MSDSRIPAQLFLSAFVGRERPKRDLLKRLRGIILWTPIVALAACGSTKERPQVLPAPPAPVIAKVAIPVACAIEQVPMPEYPGDLIRNEDDVYTLARLAMADRRVRIAERDRLRAANATPCPGAHS